MKLRSWTTHKMLPFNSENFPIEKFGQKFYYICDIRQYFVMQIMLHFTVCSTHLALWEALSKENNFCNHGRVWNNHGNGAEHALQVIRELSTTSITWKVKIVTCINRGVVLSVYVPVYLYTCIHLSTYNTHLSINLFINLPTYLLTNLPMYLFTAHHLSIHLST